MDRYDLCRGRCDTVIKQAAFADYIPVLNEDVAHEWIYAMHEKIALRLMEISDAGGVPAVTREELEHITREFLEDYIDPYMDNPCNATHVCLQTIIERIRFLTNTGNGTYAFSEDLLDFFAGIAIVDGLEYSEIKKALLLAAKKPVWHDALFFSIAHLSRYIHLRGAGSLASEVCAEINKERRD